MSALEIFNYQDQQVRTVTLDGEPHFVAGDVCDYFGVTNRNRVMQAVDPEDKGGTQIETPGGRQTVTTVNESGLYSILFALQPQKARGVDSEVMDFRIVRLRRFKRWITHEVLPTLRKTGSYSVVPALPQSYTEALRELLANVEAKEQAEARAKELEVPAKAWDVMASANGDYAVDEAAKILSRDPDIEIGRNRLFTFMQELGWIYRQGARRNWHAYQSQVDNGRIKLRMTAAFLNAKTGEMENPAPTIRITAKGMEALRTKLVPTRELVDA